MSFWMTAVCSLMILLAGGLFWSRVFRGSSKSLVISGRVKTHKGLDPGGFRIWVASMSTSGGNLEVETLGDPQGRPLETESDAQGAFSISGVPPGTHWLAFKKKGLNTRMRLVNLEDSDLTVELTLKMKDGR